MTFNVEELPTRLGFKFDPFGGGPFIVDGITHKRLTPQQIVDAYNFIALELAKRIQSDVD